MKIVMLAPFGIRPKGTLLARMLPLAQALARRGHHPTIIAPAVHNPGDAGTRVEYGGVPVVHTPQPRWPVPGVAQQVMALLGAALQAQPDLLHLFKPKGYSGLAVLLAQALRPNMPLVVDTDDWEGWGGWNDLLPYPYPAKLLFAWQERNLPRRAAAVTVASRTLEAQVRSFGVPPERVVFVPNGVDGKFSIQHSAFSIRTTNERHGDTATDAFVSRSSLYRATAPTFQRSDVPTLLLYTRFWEFDLVPFVQALVAIMGRRPAARLVVVGKGERGEERVLLRLAALAGLADRIDYRGWAAPDAIPALLATADVALVPLEDTLINRARGLAKLLELMQAGLPVVAHAVGQASEYIEQGRSGMLVPPGDTAGFARAAIELLGDAALRERLGYGAQTRVAQHFTWDHLAASVERAYEIATDL